MLHSVMQFTAVFPLQALETSIMVWGAARTALLLHFVTVAAGSEKSAVPLREPGNVIAFIKLNSYSFGNLALQKPLETAQWCVTTWCPLEHVPGLG